MAVKPEAAPVNITLFPVCVESGDAIYICIDNGNNDKRCYLVDGSKGKGGARLSTPEVPKQPQVDDIKNDDEMTGQIVPKNAKDWVKLSKVYDTLVKEHGYSLSGIIVTHPDWDHYGGIRYFLYNRKICCPVLLTYRFLTKAANEKGPEKRMNDILQKLELTHTGQIITDQKVLSSVFPPWLNFYQPFTELVLYTYTGSKGQRPSVEKDIEETATTNETSIITTICNPPTQRLACLTGDANLALKSEKNSKKESEEESEEDSKDKLKDQMERYFLNQPCIPVFLVPHHGSHNNSSSSLYEKIRSEIYIISCGENEKFQFPHKKILTAICEAACERKQNVKIVLTNGKYLDDEKMRETQDEWLKYATIYYWDKDLYAAEKEELKRNTLITQPFLKVRLYPSPCFPVKNVIEWSIEGYRNLVEKIGSEKKLLFKRDGKYLCVNGQNELILVDQKRQINVFENVPSPTTPCDWNNYVIVLKDIKNQIVFFKQIRRGRLAEFSIHQCINHPSKAQQGNIQNNKVCWGPLSFEKLDK